MFINLKERSVQNKYCAISTMKIHSKINNKPMVGGGVKNCMLVTDITSFRYTRRCPLDISQVDRIISGTRPDRSHRPVVDIGRISH